MAPVVVESVVPPIGVFGYNRNGAAGGIVATILFIFPIVRAHRSLQ